MDVKIYDKVLLKSGQTAHIVEIWNPGVAYEADIDCGRGEYMTNTINHIDIVKVITSEVKLLTDTYATA